MNTIILLGNMTRDPELRYSANKDSTAICNFTLAVRKSYVREGEPDANFIDCVAFGSTAEFIEKYFAKGQPCCIRGELNIETWQDKDGNNRRTARVSVDRVDFAGSAPSNEQSTDRSSHSSGRYNTKPSRR